jgi:DNA polymerase (family X)
MTKDDVAAALEEIGTLLQLTGENDFRVRAYTNGSRLISQYEGDFKQLVTTNKLGTIKGIGEALAEKITTLMTTGKLPFLDDLRASVPPGLLEMLKIPGVGPKKVKALHDELQIDTTAKLKSACEAGQVAELKGFGAKTQAKILEGLAFLDTFGKRVRIDQALPFGLEVLERIKQLAGVERAELCGSLRRRRETAKDLDILVSSADATPIMEAFVSMPEVLQVIGHGPTKSSVVLHHQVHGNTITLNADMRVVTPEQFPFALVYLTGSKDHNVRLRQRAIERGWSLNEYALGPVDKPIACADEAAVYAALELEYIAPELREDTGEVEAAAKKQLPKLIETKQIRGVFHNHTTYSDGTATLEAMTKKCLSLGWEYFGVGDHSQTLKMAGGLEPHRVKEQWAEIDELNKKLKLIRILKGTESDILLDGSLDYDDEMLAGFDYVVASVHSHFNLPEDEQTERICKALRHPATTMLGHATGRLLLRRDGYKLDMDRIIATAAEHGKMIEINAQPQRLDMEWKWAKRAKQEGVMIVINPDAHSPADLELVDYGVMVARRAWLEAADVFNTRSLKNVLKHFGKV